MIKLYQKIFEIKGAEEPEEGRAKYWLNSGAGVLFFAKSTKRFLLVKRAVRREFGTWGVVGGGVDEGDSEEKTAKKEAHEETGYSGPIELMPVFRFVDESAGFEYQNFVGIVEDEFPIKLNWENSDAKWFSLEEILDFPYELHFGIENILEKNLDYLKTLAGTP
jgi:8-oxo-dGTP pyrophosphatase MutT (NUDIX family)